MIKNSVTQCLRGSNRSGRIARFNCYSAICRIFQATIIWVTRSDDFSRPIAVKATEVATTLLGGLVSFNHGKSDMNVALRMEPLCQS